MEANVFVTKEIEGSTCTLFVGGVLDYSTMNPFIEHIETIRDGTEKVIVDFERLTFIDSTGIGAILNLVHEANDKDFEVEICGVQEEIRVLFDTIGVFEILDTLKKEGS